MAFLGKSKSGSDAPKQGDSLPHAVPKGERRVDPGARPSWLSGVVLPSANEEDVPRVFVPIEDFLPKIPPYLLREGDTPRDRKLWFNLKDLSQNIAHGKATIRLSTIAALCPEIFAKAIGSDDDAEIVFPWHRLAGQLRNLKSAGAIQGDPDLARTAVPPPRIPLREPVSEPPPPDKADETPAPETAPPGEPSFPPLHPTSDFASESQADADVHQVVLEALIHEIDDLRKENYRLLAMADVVEPPRSEPVQEAAPEPDAVGAAPETVQAPAEAPAGPENAGLLRGLLAKKEAELRDATWKLHEVTRESETARSEILRVRESYSKRLAEITRAADERRRELTEIRGMLARAREEAKMVQEVASVTAVEGLEATKRERERKASEMAEAVAAKERVTEEAESLRRTLDAAKRETAEAAAAFDAERKRWETDVRSLAQRGSEAAKRIEDLEKEISGRDGIIERIERELASVVSARDASQASLKKMEDRLAAAEKAKAESEEHFKGKFENLRSERDKALSELREGADARVASAQKEIAELRAQIEKTRSEFDASAKTRDKALAEKAAAIGRLEKEAETRRREIAGLVEARAAAEKAKEETGREVKLLRDNFQRELQVAQRERGAAQDELRQIAESVKTLTHAREAAALERDDALIRAREISERRQREVAGLSKERDEALAGKENALSELARLKESLGKQIGSLTKSLGQVESEREKVVAELAEMREGRSGAEKERAAREEEIGKVRSERDTLGAEIEALRKDLEGANRRAELLEKKAGEIGQSGKVQIAELMKSVDEHRHARDTLVEELRQKEDAYAKRVEFLNRANDSLSERLEALEERADALAEERRALKAELEAARLEAGTLREKEMALRVRTEKIPELEKVAGEVRELSSRLKSATAERDRLATEIEKSRTSAKAELERVRGELGAATKAKVLVEQRMRSLETASVKVGLIEKELASAKSERERLTATLEKERVAAKNEIERLRADASARTKDLERAISGRSGAAKALDAAKAELERVRSELAALTKAKGSGDERLRSIEAAAGKVGALEKELSSAKAEKERLSAMLETERSAAKADADRRRVESESRAKEIEALASKVSEASQSRKAATAEVERLQAELRKREIAYGKHLEFVSSAHDRETEKRIDAEEKVLELSTRLTLVENDSATTLQKEREMSISARAEFDKLLDQAVSEGAGAKAEVERLRADLAAASKVKGASDQRIRELEAATSKIALIEKELASARSEKEAASAAFGKERAAAKADLERLRAEIDRRAKEIEQATSQVAEATKTLEIAKLDADGLRAGLREKEAALRKHLEFVSTAHDRETEKRIEAEEKIAELSAKLSDVEKGALAALERERDSATSARGEIEKLRAELASSEKAKGAGEERIKELETNLVSARAEKDRFAADAAEREKAMADARAKLVETEKRASETSHAVAAARGDAESAGDRIRELEETIKKNAELAEIALYEKNREIEKAMSQVESLRQSLETLRTERERTDAAARDEMAALRKKMEFISTAHDTATEQRLDLEEEVARLRAELQAERERGGRLDADRIVTLESKIAAFESRLETRQKAESADRVARSEQEREFARIAKALEDRFAVEIRSNRELADRAVEEMERSRSEVSGRVEGVEREKAALAAELEVARKSGAEASAQREAAAKEIEGLKGRLAEIETVLAEMEAARSDLESVRTELAAERNEREELVKKMTEGEASGREVRELAEERDRLFEELSGLKETFAAGQAAKLAQLEVFGRQYRSVIRERDEAIKKGAADRSRLEGELEALKIEKADLEKERQELLALPRLQPIRVPPPVIGRG
jgi:chromosome segregation ATPase